MAFGHISFMKIIKDYLDYDNQKTNALFFYPPESVKVMPTFAIFGHGYTSDKSSILNWATRLAEVGVCTAIFDWPGHFLGNYSEVLDFNYFKEHAHMLYLKAFNGLNSHFNIEMKEKINPTSVDEFELVLGGHSLGAMLSLKALDIPDFQKFNKRAILVGLGMAPKKVVHLFDTPFYKATLIIRNELVSKELHSDNVFPWIKKEKEDLTITNHKIHFITGVDDLVVGEDGTERFVDHLLKLGNFVTMEKPTKLPHHEPNLAAAHIKKYFKDQKLFF